MTTKALDAVIVRSPDAAWLAIDDEVVVYSGVSNVSIVLNPLAALLWQLLDGEHTLAQNYADLAEVTGRSSEQLATEFDSVIEQWVAYDVITGDVGGGRTDD